jgi:hypothetical protein
MLSMDPWDIVGTTFTDCKNITELKKSTYGLIYW